MVLKTIALVLYSAALLIALAFGYGWSFGAMLFNINPGALNSFQAGVQRNLSPALWDSIFVPLLQLPAWVIPVAIGTLFVLISALRPGKG
jgi:hypothetical protein